MSDRGLGRDRPADVIPGSARCRAIGVEVRTVVRLVVLKAHVDGFGPDDWQIMEALHRWALGMPHRDRLRWLEILSIQADDLLIASGETMPAAVEAVMAS